MVDSLTGIELSSPIVIVMRLTLAMLAGFLIGFEREKHHQAAGVRTHMALALGASLVMLLSIFIPTIFYPDAPESDPGRLAAQVISGIGFLGAGAIFRFGFDVRGLTTAASIWTTSGIGLAFGAGFYWLGVIGTAFLIIVLQVFEFVENFMVAKRYIRFLHVTFRSDQYEANKVINRIKQTKLEIRQVSLKENVEEKTTELIVNCRISDDFSIRELFDNIKSLGHIISIRID